MNRNEWACTIPDRRDDHLLHDVAAVTKMGTKQHHGAF